MPKKQKKIAAIITFALAGFLCGWTIAPDITHASVIYSYSGGGSPLQVVYPNHQLIAADTIISAQSGDTIGTYSPSLCMVPYSGGGSAATDWVLTGYIYDITAASNWTTPVATSQNTVTYSQLITTICNGSLTGTPTPFYFTPYALTAGHKYAATYYLTAGTYPGNNTEAIVQASDYSTSGHSNIGSAYSNSGDQTTYHEYTQYAGVFSIDGTNTNVPPYAHFTSPPIFDLVHQTVTFQGVAIASSTSQGSQYLQFWQTNPALGSSQPAEYLATTTGAFSLTFPLYSNSFSISATSTSYTLGGDIRAYGRIYAEPLYFNPQATILDATSSLQVSTTTTVNTQSAASLAGLPEPADCGVTALTGCIKNAAVWLFYPTSDATAQFGTLSLRGTFPFEYVYQINDVRQAMLSASSTAATSVTVPLWKLPGQTATSSLVMISSSLIAAVPYTGTVKTIITAILYVLMAEYVYYRVIRAHDPNTP